MVSELQWKWNPCLILIENACMFCLFRWRFPEFNVLSWFEVLDSQLVSCMYSMERSKNSIYTFVGHNVYRKCTHTCWVQKGLCLDFMECFFCEFDHCGRVYKVDFMKKSLHNCTLEKLLYLRCFLLVTKFSTVFCWILTLVFERKVIL